MPWEIFFIVHSLEQSSKWQYPYFGDTHRVRLVEESLHVKNQLDTYSRFDRTPTCYRQSQTNKEAQDRSQYRASTACVRQKIMCNVKVVGTTSSDGLLYFTVI